MVLGIVMSFPYGLISFDKKILELIKPLREVVILFVVLKETGFTLQEKLPSIAVARFM